MYIVCVFIHTAPSTGTVEQVTVDVLSSTSVNVSWLPASRDNMNGVITHYIVEYRLIRSVRDMMYGSCVSLTVYDSGTMYASRGDSSCPLKQATTAAGKIQTKLRTISYTRRM